MLLAKRRATVVPRRNPRRSASGRALAALALSALTISLAGPAAGQTVDDCKEAWSAVEQTKSTALLQQFTLGALRDCPQSILARGLLKEDDALRGELLFLTYHQGAHLVLADSAAVTDRGSLEERADEIALQMLTSTDAHAREIAAAVRGWSELNDDAAPPTNPHEPPNGNRFDDIVCLLDRKRPDAFGALLDLTNKALDQEACDERSRAADARWSGLTAQAGRRVASGATARISVVYDSASPELEGIQAYLTNLELLEGLAASLAPLLAPNSELVLRARSCGAEQSGFGEQGSRREIDLCYETVRRLESQTLSSSDDGNGRTAGRRVKKRPK